MNTVRPKEVLFLFVLSTGLLNHVIIIPALLEAAGRDAWLGVLIGVIPYLLYIYLLFFISQNIGQSGLSLWINANYGKIAYLLFSFPLLLLLFINALITLVDVAIWIKTYFLSEMPFLVIVLIIVTSSFWITNRSFKQLTIMSTIVLPIVVVLGFFIMSVNVKHKNMEYLFPLFLNGYLPMFKGTFYAFSGLIEIFFILLVQHHVKNSYQFKQIVFLGLILVGLTFGPLSASIMEFGPVIATNLEYPAYEEWKLLEMGEFVTRLDFFAMFQWTSGAFIRISLFMYMASELVNKNKRKRMTFFAYILLFCLALIPISSYLVHRFLFNYFLPLSLLVIFFLSLILFFMILIKNRKEKNKNAGELGHQR